MERLISVVLKYLPNKNDAPEIIASGRDLLAEYIVKIAQKNGIPIVKDKYIAKILSALPVGTEIPENLYEAIASIFSFIQYVENRHKGEKSS